MPTETTEEKLFVGPNEVDRIELVDQKTPAGKDVAKVFYKGEGDRHEIMPLAIFNILKTNEPKDYNWLREKKHGQLLKDLAALCLEADVKHSDLAHVSKSLCNNLEDAFERAASFLWTGDDKAWISGIDHRFHLTLLQADAVLNKIQADGKSA